jgi:hypothetical protein
MGTRAMYDDGGVENDHQLTGHDDGQRDRSGPFLSVRRERHVVSLNEDLVGNSRDVGVFATHILKSHCVRPPEDLT